MLVHGTHARRGVAVAAVMCRPSAFQNNNASIVGMSLHRSRLFGGIPDAGYRPDAAPVLQAPGTGRPSGSAMLRSMHRALGAIPRPKIAGNQDEDPTTMTFLK